MKWVAGVGSTERTSGSREDVATSLFAGDIGEVLPLLRALFCGLGEILLDALPPELGGHR